MVFRNKLFDWHRRIRSLRPKQPRQRIPMFNMHGTPLLPQAELERIESYFGELYLSGEIRKVETDRVAVGTISGEGLSLVFQERAPWSIVDETNKAREHKKAQEGHRCG